jgi:hypothetical protein
MSSGNSGHLLKKVFTIRSPSRRAVRSGLYVSELLKLQHGKAGQGPARRREARRGGQGKTGEAMRRAVSRGRPFCVHHSRLHGERQPCGPPGIRRGGSGSGSSSSSISSIGTGRGLGGAGRRLGRGLVRFGFGPGGSARRISASALRCHRRSLGVAGTITARLASGCSRRQWPEPHRVADHPAARALRSSSSTRIRPQLVVVDTPLCTHLDESCTEVCP